MSTQIGALAPTTLTYDSRGRLASVTQSSRSSKSTYDPEGRLDGVIDPLGLKTTYTYDADGRLLATTLADGRVINPTRRQRECHVDRSLWETGTQLFLHEAQPAVILYTSSCGRACCNYL